MTPNPSGIRAAGRALLFALLGSCVALGCEAPPSRSDDGDEEASDEERDFSPCVGAALRIRIAGADGLDPARILVFGFDSEASALSLRCPDGPPSGHALCTSEGASWEARPVPRSVALKIRGAPTEIRSISDDARARAESACRGEADPPDIDFAPSPLPPFLLNDDYATGFSADGLDAFKAMTLETPQESGVDHEMKFYIDDLRGSPKVYFQNTLRHPLHYAFVRDVLGKPLTEKEYVEETYRGEARTAMGGYLLLHEGRCAPSEALGEEAESPLTIRFFPRDDLSPALALTAYRLLEERLNFLSFDSPVRRLFYLPASSSHEAQLAEETNAFRALGALWMTIVELNGRTTVQLLNPGLAYGTLRRLTPEELEKQVVSFRDLLLLPYLPNELPLCGGTITGELQTPLAHVNVAARARGTPNLALIGAEDHPDLAPLVGRLARFEVTPAGWSIRAAEREEAEAFWAGRLPDPVSLPEADLSASGFPDFADLGFEDARQVGSKAANLAELHSVLPDHAPDGFAVPFSSYDRFIRERTLSEALCDHGTTLCLQSGRPAEICEAVEADCRTRAREGTSIRDYARSGFDSPLVRSDTERRDAFLTSLRAQIEGSPLDDETARALDEKVAARFGPVRVRLRSSTNSEDLENFSGAGLYRSHSASTDGEEDLPSVVIRRVWASLWGFQAVEERAFWGLDHFSVYMGVAIHPAFPDEEVNGVLITRNLADPAVEGFYVNVQKGETSVTNPVNGALPEIFSIVFGSERLEVVRLRFSSLSPDTPLMTEEEIRFLFRQAARVANHFAPLYGEFPDQIAFDMEFKLDGIDRSLSIKQVRPYHQRTE